MKDSKQMLEVELKNLEFRYNFIKNKEQVDKPIIMFALFNLASKLEYKAVDRGEIELVYKVKDLQTKIIDFIIRSLRRK